MSGDTSRHDILISVSISGPHRYSGATLRAHSRARSARDSLTESTDRVTHQMSHLICSFTATGFPFEGPPALFSLITTSQSARLNGVWGKDICIELCFPLSLLMRSEVASTQHMLSFMLGSGELPRISSVIDKRFRLDGNLFPHDSPS
ncbi:hypothetical protein FVEG_14971 [Fusarium verticillioides 7600]|uniref:Uncharacterized protein n=1 Tax=Gibberella moniliformis (strain M3125 / FGSC 7600) TaxID=334819 RepID=W7LU77_GIBM7|nr:hypothetical protein FVEG_14971 [Fusarium verticillioides 7600]EWG39009.1 hypothetical protein FVEG_14971 [Fusarium verticillioides 7600]